MEQKKKKEARSSLQSKIIVSFIVIVLGAILTMSLLGLASVTNLLELAKKREEIQTKTIEAKSRESIMEVIYGSLWSIVVAESDKLDGEFWIIDHSFTLLSKQVQDVFKNPEYYNEREVEPPKAENAGKCVLQMTYADRESLNDEESMRMVRKLANLAPTMKELVEGNKENVIECLIALPNGITLFMDEMSDKKIDRDGVTVDTYDPRVREWYRGAVKQRGMYITSVRKSYYYGIQEIMLGIPVYVDGELVAVLEGAIKLDKLQEMVSRVIFGDTGFSILISKDSRIIYSPREEGDLAIGKNLSRDIADSYTNTALRHYIDEARENDTGFGMVYIDGELYYLSYARLEVPDWTQMVFIAIRELEEPTEEILDEMNKIYEQTSKEGEESKQRILIIRLLLTIVLIVISVIVAKAIAKKVLNPINVMTEDLEDISGDNFIFELKDIYKTGDEIEVLAYAFEDLSEKTRKYIEEITTITAEKEKIEVELNVATKIQADMLPSDFPLFPNRHEFDLYAVMDPAKEVGGDFYDVFLIDDDHLCLVMGDVSGKGVPAALFMVISKTMIKNRANMGGGPAEILSDVNNALSEGNNEKMFVTVWLGILTISTGVIIEANAGHEHPAIMKANGDFEILYRKHGLVMGAMEDVRYKEDSFTLEKGDHLFVYTDGVPEATNASNVLFGKERMIEVLNRHKDDNPEDLLIHTKEDIEAFVGEAPQFDDLTMLAFYYKDSDVVQELSSAKTF